MRLYFDFHIHSCLSPCASDDMTPLNIVNMASLAGLDVIAVCDHNSVKNCAAVLKAANHASIIALPGMELTVSGDVHVLCLFNDLNNAEDFGSFVYSKLPNIENHPELFGNQWIYDEYDHIIGVEERLLMNATDISIFEISAIAEDYGGFALPAHINRKVFSLLGTYGFYNPDMKFSIAETTRECDLDELRREHPELRNLKFIKNSDSHSLNTIYDAEYTVETAGNAPEDIIKALKNCCVSI